MSDSEGDSRTAAVGRKRNAAGEFKPLPEDRRLSTSSKESGEVSSSSESDNDNNDSEDEEDSDSDSDIEEISADQWSKRRKTEASTEQEDGEVSSDSSSNSDSDNSGSVLELPLPKALPKSNTNTQTLISDLPLKDREAQLKYFPHTTPSAPVHCLSCGIRGHMASSCPARTCSHCFQRDLHASNACPTYRKCGLCRERGHDARVCRNRSAVRGGVDDECDVCGGRGHVEEECVMLWRIEVRLKEGDGEGRGKGREWNARRHDPGALNYDDDEDEGSSSPPPPPPPLERKREERRPWQLMGLFDDGRD
ncbi:Putative Zinc finger, CCHC-type [Septoria linicola]|uniref:Zinc finger, CCHC-type n=1 Tax=Septoria linicola TaxID=215465 RepID=A0A9Q9AVA1_9PEZI|nr:Putative Zinc finger, CCHC-type [Septoria linicola]